MTRRHGITEQTVQRFVIGPGAVFRDFVNPSTPGVLLGATLGGNTVNIQREWHVPELDGALGPVRGARHLIAEVPSLQANLIEVTRDNLLLALAGTSSASFGSPQTHDQITSAGAISVGNYLTNVAIVGQRAGTNNPIVFIVRNALSTEPVEMSLGTGKDDDVVLQVTFTGHYTAASPALPPYEILSPI